MKEFLQSVFFKILKYCYLCFGKIKKVVKILAVNTDDH